MIQLSNARTLNIGAPDTTYITMNYYQLFLFQDGLKKYKLNTFAYRSDAVITIKKSVMFHVRCLDSRLN